MTFNLKDQILVKVFSPAYEVNNTVVVIVCYYKTSIEILNFWQSLKNLQNFSP